MVANIDSIVERGERLELLVRGNVVIDVFTALGNSTKLCYFAYTKKVGNGLP